MNETMEDNSTMLTSPDTMSYRCGAGLNSFHQEYAKMHGWASLLVCIFGSIANSLNIMVLSRREMSSPTNAILTGLAVADLLVMMEYIPYASHMYLYHRPRRDTYTYGWAVFVFFHSIFTQVCHTISIWLTVTLAIWRYIAVAHPQRNREWCSFRRTVFAIAGAYVICPLICLPGYFTTALTSKVEILDSEGRSPNMTIYNATIGNDTASALGANKFVNSTLWYVDLSETMKVNSLLNLANFWMYSVVIKLIPCLALTILSLRLILALMEAKKRRKMLTTATLVRTDEKNIDNNHSLDVVTNGKKSVKKKSSRLLDKERQTDRTTRMLLAVLLLFLLTEFPQGVLGLLSVILGSGFFRTCYVKLGELMDILALINSAINFILYCAMSRQFRTTFSQLFCRWKLFGRWTPVPRHPDNNGITGTNHTVTQGPT
ncbi:G-protein coupled receptor dmsr-1-like isoform X2 [Venturia canescens]|uniref:G-protein coupled receptor dmsr-1-like isoform X2 n=1 Tax=Venturia canescens TaxID=32260 RepID=UPI001C9D4CB8|nr:G-protein coupled receptor dmsr-1-like isoform X2 [Venturia canescens]